MYTLCFSLHSKFQLIIDIKNHFANVVLLFFTVPTLANPFINYLDYCTC